MTYSEKLQDPRWQKKRLEVMQRDNFTCVCCGDKETTLNVHHLKYTGEPWKAPNEALITTCKHCHTAIEFLKIEWLPHFKIIKKHYNGDTQFTYLFFIEDNSFTICYIVYKKCEKIISISHKTMSELVHHLIDFWLQSNMDNFLIDKNCNNG